MATVRQITTRPALWIIMMMMVVQSIWSPHARASADESGLQTITRLCGGCHGLSMNHQCIAGKCGEGRVHAITPQPWELVIPWMKALGCRMTESEESAITTYLMDHFGKRFPIRWERAGTTAAGWNIVSFGEFHGRLYAGVEGSGSIYRLDDRPPPGGPAWTKVLETSNYTVYGLTRFGNRLFAATNDPAAEIWSSGDGEHWQQSSRLDKEKGIISLGVFDGALYAGTTQASIYRSSDGIAWTRVYTLVPNAEQSFSNWVRFILPFEGALFAGIEKTGVYRLGRASTWNRVWPAGEEPGNGNSSSGVRGAAVFNEVLYVGTTNHGEIYSIGSKRDSNATLVFSPELPTKRGYVGSMTVFGNHLYAAIGGSVFQTGEGKIWEEIGRLGPFTIEAMAGFDHRLYAGTALPPDAWIYRTSGLANQSAPVRPPVDSKP